MKRKAKKGHFYIIKGYEDGAFNYKYGASSDIMQRLKSLNINRRIKFKPFVIIPSVDIFKTENDFKNWLMFHNNYFGCEYFNLIHDIKERDIRKKVKEYL